MKRIVTTTLVAAVLLGSAIFYGLQTPSDEPQPATPAPPSQPAPQPESPRTHQRVDGLLSLEATSSHGYIAPDQPETVYTAVDVTARDIQGVERPPLDIALVVDRSGSMRGQKLAHAKRAAHTIIDMLEEGDRLSLVSYHSSARLEFGAHRLTRSARSRMHAAVRRLAPAGGTNIAEALDLGLSQLDRAKASPQTVHRMVLLSDGRPTVGQTDLDRLVERSRRADRRSVSVSTMGVGVNYHEDLMTRLANLGGGQYHFIDAPKQVVSMFQEELNGLAQTVATDGSLVIEMGPQVDLKAVHGWPHRQEGDRIFVSLASFSARQNKSLLLEWTARRRAGPPSALVDIGLSYRDLTAAQPAHQRASLSLAASADADRRASSRRASVVSRVQQVEVAHAMSQAMEAFKRGQTAEARGLIDRRKRAMKQAHRQFDLNDDRMKTMQKQLEGTERNLQQHSSDSRAGKAVIKRQKAKSNVILLDSAALK